jgi:hypothetical protein
MQLMMCRDLNNCKIDPELLAMTPVQAFGWLYRQLVKYRRGQMNWVDMRAVFAHTEELILIFSYPTQEDAVAHIRRLSEVHDFERSIEMALADDMLQANLGLVDGEEI